MDAKIVNDVPDGMKPSPIGSLQFAVKNNSTKSIDAVVIQIASTFASSDGKDRTITGYTTRNQLVHPDIREIHNQNPLPPGQLYVFGPEPLQTGDGVLAVKKITLSIDYVDFEDRSTLGPNVQGGSSVLLVREGAAKYKAWIVKQFREGKSEELMLSILREPNLPEELGFKYRHENVGAKLYRRHLLMAYQHHGKSVFEKYLK